MPAGSCTDGGARHRGDHGFCCRDVVARLASLSPRRRRGIAAAALLYAAAGALALSFAIGAVVFDVVILLGLVVALSPRAGREPAPVGAR